MSSQVFDWWSWVAKQGVFAAMLIAAASWFASSIVIPMRNDQTRFMESVIDTNRQHAAVAQQQTLIQQQQATALAGLVDQQRQTTEILKQIRDDTRVGAWNQRKSEQP